MTTRILCLSLIFILSSVSPFNFIQSFMRFPGAEKINRKKFFERGFLAVLIMVTITAVILIEGMREVGIPKEWWYYIGAVGIVPLIIGLEFLIEFARLKSKGIQVKGIDIRGSFKNRSMVDLLIIVLIGIFEEIVYRKLWFIIFGNFFNLNIVIVILISSLVYAFNHMHLGDGIFYQKLSSGLIFSILFVCTGSILIPIVAHGVQNIFVIMVGRK